MATCLKSYGISIIAALTLAVLFPPSYHAWAGDCCVGYMNIELIVAESTMGKQAAEKFKKELDERQDALGKLYEKVKILKTYIETKANLLNDKELTAKYEEYNNAVRDFQKAKNDSEAEFKAKNDTSIKNILEKIEPILKKLATEKGLLLVVKDPSMLGYVHPSVDITSEILKRLEAQTAAKP